MREWLVEREHLLRFEDTPAGRIYVYNRVPDAPAPQELVPQSPEKTQDPDARIAALESKVDRVVDFVFIVFVVVVILATLSLYVSLR